jgi:branched-chain amino acid transport system ATP-binding protein/urea transport system ATP-binding protein
MSNLLETHGLTVTFGGITAVDAVDFDIAPDELRCIIGPNGAGKTTFFKCITGQLRPTRGDIRVEGRSLLGLDSHDVARLGIGIKMQVPQLFDGLDVWENVWLSAWRKNSNRRAEKVTGAILDRFKISHLARRTVSHLAHGQRQLVEFAMVLAGEPKLILLDEPAAGMSDEEAAQMADIITETNRGAALIVIEHDMQFVRQIASTITVFHRGAILIEDRAETVLTDPTVREIYLGKQAQAGHA